RRGGLHRAARGARGSGSRGATARARRRGRHGPAARGHAMRTHRTETTMTTTTTARPRPPHRLMTSLWSLAVPAALAGATALWARTERARLPEPLAVHWGTEGPDRAGTFTELVTLPLAVVAPLFTLAMWALAFFLGHAALTRRIAAASSVWCAAMVSGVTA